MFLFKIFLRAFKEKYKLFIYFKLLIEKQANKIQADSFNDSSVVSLFCHVHQLSNMGMWEVHDAISCNVPPPVKINIDTNN